MATKINPTETFPLTYRTDALRTLSEQLCIPPTRISKFFGYTNNKTVDRWIAGNDIYVASLVNICNTFRIDLLSFFTYEGKTFNTNLGDIIAMEKAGINLRNVIEEHNVKPCSYNDFRTLSPLTPHDATPADDPKHPSRHTTSAIGTSEQLQSMPTEFIDRIIAMQCQAHEHERQMLEQQRADMQTIIDDKDKQIAKLEKELKRLRVIERASKPYMGIVADDGEQ